MDSELYRRLRQDLQSGQEGVASMLNVSRETITRRETDKRRVTFEGFLALLYLHDNKSVSAKLLLTGIVRMILSEGFRCTNEIVNELRERKDYNHIIKPHMRKLEIRATIEHVKSLSNDPEENFWYQMEIVLRACRHHREEAAKVILKRLVRQLMIERAGITNAALIAALRDKHDYMIAVSPNLSDMSIKEIVEKRFFKLGGNQK